MIHVETGADLLGQRCRLAWTMERSFFRQLVYMDALTKLDIWRCLIEGMECNVQVIAIMSLLS
jgi:hypothetical protein